ncbi:helix-turn-helix domain-containing protein [Kordiimonas sp. SCSIO 12603]|uniref:helix-turn-helix domain-containing protein n=1 Tax=Kordiimonas sp. SCSIO 12603 TaxID=2829596 RepID=UPI00210475D4|nr:helix-turn-helix domain-containing protein [Kordiimonas sp. SCSIO 12603]UTW60249.1 helix-turn-helix domain-containing protein [Kordiimonas sp. SCSIO 12603]
MNPAILDIAEVAKLSGLPASTIRFYEEKDLVRSIGRRGLRRLFEPNVLLRLQLIVLGQQSGFSLEEIGAMFTEGGTEINREQLLVKADELDRNIKQLTAMRDGLRHAAVCEAPSHLECPRFQKVMKITNKKYLRDRQKQKI